MNDLVKRLTSGPQPIAVGGPDPDIDRFRASVERDYVHIKFTATQGGTDLGVSLDQPACSYENADMDAGTGQVHLEGTLILDYVPVRCVADLDLARLQGTGYLEVARSNDEGAETGEEQAPEPSPETRPADDQL